MRKATAWVALGIGLALLGAGAWETRVYPYSGLNAGVVVDMGHEQCIGVEVRGKPGLFGHILWAGDPGDCK